MNETTLRSKLNTIKEIVQEIETELDSQVKVFSLESIQESICNRFGIKLNEITEVKNLKGKLKGDLCYILPIYCYLLNIHVTDNKRAIKELIGRSSTTSSVYYLEMAQDFIDLKNKIFLGHLENIIEQCKNSQKKN